MSFTPVIFKLFSHILIYYIIHASQNHTPAHSARTVFSRNLPMLADAYGNFPRDTG